MTNPMYHACACDHQTGEVTPIDHPAMPTHDPAVAHAVAQAIDALTPDHVGGAVMTLHHLPVALQYTHGPGGDIAGGADPEMHPAHFGALVDQLYQILEALGLSAPDEGETAGDTAANAFLAGKAFAEQGILANLSALEENGVEPELLAEAIPLGGD